MFGEPQDALFGIVLVANALIGIVQEFRAKRTLDSLAVLSAPKARVVRDGHLDEIAVEDVVLDDLLELRTGDQVPADGVVRSADGLEIDESLLTGESDPVDKPVDAEVLSGSIVVAGAGRFQATAVGARRVRAQARHRGAALLAHPLRAGRRHQLPAQDDPVRAVPDRRAAAAGASSATTRSPTR